MEFPEFVYTSCYCEENVFMLCKSLMNLQLCRPDASDLFVVFISNERKQVPFWCQKNSRSEGGFCLWDYHVICVQKSRLAGGGEASVWDLDTTLGCPVQFERYVKDALLPQIVQGSEYERLFRVVSAPVFLKHFASDRRHMKTKDGNWMATPPVYDCIVAHDGVVHNLESYVNMSCDGTGVLPTEKTLESLFEGTFGRVLPEETFYDLFSSSEGGESNITVQRYAPVS